jgi:steroid delta-isomerase-like uncharacterized protein
MSESLDPRIAGAIEKAIVGAPFGDLIGLRCESIATDRVRVRLPFRRELTTLGEMVHGGAIASLVDVAATAAAWAHPHAELGARGSTVGFSLSFLAPGLARDLVADARIAQRGGTLCVCDVAVEDAAGAAVARALVTYRLSPPKRASTPAGPREDARLASVRAYAEAKSRQDVAGALADCAPDFAIETIPFGTASAGREESAAQLRLFFSVFPDYRAETEGVAAQGESVAWWGRISLTFEGELFGRPPTGRTASLPAFSVFDFRDGRLARERFFFDLAMLCEQIGLPVEALSEPLRGLRAAAA